MRITCRTALWLAGLTLSVLAVLPPAAAQVAEAQAELVMRESGLWEQIADIGPQLKQGFEQAAQQPPPEMGEGGPDLFRRLAAATVDAFSPVMVRLTARRELAARMDPQHLQPQKAWFESPAGRRVTALEVAKSAKRGDPQARVLFGQQRLAAATPQRRASLLAFSEASRNAEASAGMLINLRIALQAGVASAVGRTDLPPLEEQRRQLEPLRQQMQASLAPMLEALAAELYEPLSDADLQAYVAFLQSAAGRQLTDAVLLALDRMVIESAEELGRLVAPR